MSRMPKTYSLLLKTATLAGLLVIELKSPPNAPNAPAIEENLEVP